MTDSMVAAAIRQEFPKHSKAAYSLAKRSAESGVMLVPRAQEIADAMNGAEPPQKKRQPKRKKSVRFSARLSPETADAVKQKMRAEGIASKQTLIEALLIQWVKKDEAPAAGTAETPKKK